MEDAMTAEEAGTRWDALLARLGRDRAEERHGAGVLVRVHGRPAAARGCLLPDGTSTEARCVAAPGGPPREPPRGPQAGAAAHPEAEGRAQAAGDVAPAPIDPADCVWQRCLVEGGPMTRRGRVLVEPGAALRFVDEPLAGEGDGWAAPAMPNLEHDLAASPEIARRVRSDVFAQLLYAALCNTEWRQGATGEPWSCSWRAAGGLVAHLRGEGSYLDWYCSGAEGLVDEGVLAAIEGVGWKLAREARASS